MLILSIYKEIEYRSNDKLRIEYIAKCNDWRTDIYEIQSEKYIYTLLLKS